MSRFLLLLVLSSGLRIWCYFVDRYYKRREIVQDEFYDLRSLIITPMQEDELSVREWRELLPVCRFADERFRRWCDPCLDGKKGCEAFVVQILERLQEV